MRTSELGAGRISDALRPCVCRRNLKFGKRE